MIHIHKAGDQSGVRLALPGIATYEAYINCTPLRSRPNRPASEIGGDSIVGKNTHSRRTKKKNNFLNEDPIPKEGRHQDREIGRLAEEGRRRVYKGFTLRNPCRVIAEQTAPRAGPDGPCGGAIISGGPACCRTRSQRSNIKLPGNHSLDEPPQISAIGTTTNELRA